MATETSESGKRVDLGFVNDDCDPRLLKSHYFPSKVGGKPAWLSLNPIPPTDRLTCSKCSGQLVFLMQVYSPRNEQPDAFHRTLFLFVCRNPSCCSPNDAANFTVFRSQLPRVNQFFSADPPPDDPSEYVGVTPSAGKYQSLCVVCGCVGTKQCSQCHSVNYCGKEHQSRHWKAGHKKTCGKQGSQESAEDIMDCGVLFPEFELEIEDEDYSPEQTLKDEEEALQEFQQYVHDIQTNQSGAAQGTQYTEEDLPDLEELAAKETEDGRQFKKFQKRVAHKKDQVLRYCKGGEPLWVSSEHKAKLQDIPDCSCGAPRQFEFQVMPQLLNYLGVDEKVGNSLDWGTLCVYSCSRSCATGNNYTTEFIWKQDFAADR